MTDRPLAGCGVLLSRPLNLVSELATAIESAGADVTRYPAMDIAGVPPADVAATLAGCTAPDIVIFISRNAVEHGAAAVAAGAASAAIAAIGPTTRDALEAAGLDASIVPEQGFDSESLLEHPALQDVAGRNVLIVRGQGGRERLATELRVRGANVDYLAVYDRRRHQPTEAEAAALAAALDRGVHFVVVMSAETVGHLLAILPPAALTALQSAALVAPSARVLQTAKELLPDIPAVLASGPRTPDIVDALTGQWQTRNNP